MKPEDVESLLNFHADKYNDPSFIETDPISIPHQFSKKQDIEIMGFWTAILSWGQRKTIINKANELKELMGNSPYDFICNHTEKDRKEFLNFKHRTFQTTDTLYFLEFLQYYYQNNDSLETAFITSDKNLESGIIQFRNLFFSLPDAPQRTQKHISSPEKKSTCKRICMFLRWMVRNDKKGVDFGIWNQIAPNQLFIPFDVHVERVARHLNLIQRKQKDWKTVLELTTRLKELDPLDPIKYDFALFGLGVLKKDEFL